MGSSRVTIHNLTVLRVKANLRLVVTHHSPVILRLRIQRVLPSFLTRDLLHSPHSQQCLHHHGGIGDPSQPLSRMQSL